MIASVVTATMGAYQAARAAHLARLSQQEMNALVAGPGLDLREPRDRWRCSYCTGSNNREREACRGCGAGRGA